jgi:anti-anti-sigma regulatory factor
MTTQVLTEPVHDVVTELTAAGLRVTLSGPLGSPAAARLRRALLRPLEPGRRQVVLDAQDVTAVSEPCLAVLLAAAVWTVQAGGSFTYLRVGEPLRELANELGLGELVGSGWRPDQLADVIALPERAG